MNTFLQLLTNLFSLFLSYIIFSRHACNIFLGISERPLLTILVSPSVLSCDIRSLIITSLVTINQTQGLITSVPGRTANKSLPPGALWKYDSTNDAHFHLTSSLVVITNSFSLHSYSGHCTTFIAFWSTIILQFLRSKPVRKRTLPTNGTVIWDAEQFKNTSFSFPIPSTPSLVITTYC